MKSGTSYANSTDFQKEPIISPIWAIPEDLL